MKNQRGSVVVIILVSLLLIVSTAFAYFIGTQREKPLSLEYPQESEIPVSATPTPIIVATPTSSPNVIIPTGWKTYKNTQYGFEISYPSNYQVLTDANSLYGWPKAVALIYDGGQSYDLAIEYWNTEAECMTKYKNQNNLTIKKIGNYYISLVNTNFEAEVDKMIQTFKPL